MTVTRAQMVAYLARQFRRALDRFAGSKNTDETREKMARAIVWMFKPEPLPMIVLTLTFGEPTPRREHDTGDEDDARVAYWASP